MAVYWITGLSGAGKSTIGYEYYLHMKSLGESVVFLDGDDLRLIMGIECGYEPSERKKISYRYARLSKMLSEQNVHVVIATISMFNEVREWNRKNILDYVEIYIKVPLEILIKRDQKNLYSNNVDNVMGFNAHAEEPLNPDVILINDGSKSPEEITSKLIILINKTNHINEV
jgi:adenylylsulfate kinase-like enzyme